MAKDKRELGRGMLKEACKAGDSRLLAEAMKLIASNGNGVRVKEQPPIDVQLRERAVDGDLEAVSDLQTLEAILDEFEILKTQEPSIDKDDLLRLFVKAYKAIVYRNALALMVPESREQAEKFKKAWLKLEGLKRLNKILDEERREAKDSGYTVTEYDNTYDVEVGQEGDQ